MVEARRRLTLALPSLFATAGVGLLLLGILGVSYGGRTWLTWMDIAGALVAFVGAATLRTPDVLGLALSALLMAVLTGLWLFSLTGGVARWLVWLHGLAALGFLGLTALNAALGTSSLRTHVDAPA